MKTYVIITSGDVSSVDFSKVQETSAETLRWNNDKTKTFVKYTGDKPSFLNGKTEYTIDELLAILDVVDGEWWTDQD
jgi:hypothetical protein|tara:strand:- start:367 stop:597 length:231 start_codon:yes stop_codon:yes gene_type:complete